MKTFFSSKMIDSRLIRLCQDVVGPPVYLNSEFLLSATRPRPAISRGFTLIELIIVVAILSIISAIAIPAYQGYIAEARAGTMLQSIEMIRVFQEDRRVQQGEYVEGSYDPLNPDVPGGLKDTAVLGWSPNASNDVVTFVITCQTPAVSPECTRSSGYQVTASHSEGGSVCRIHNQTSVTSC